MKFERSVLRTLVAAFGFLIVGIVFLVLANSAPADWQRILLLNVGSFVIASVVMALVFEHWQMRAVIEDLFDQARIVEQVKSAQITGFSTSFHQLPWQELFAGSTYIDIMFAYGGTWRNAHREELSALAAVKDARIRVVLPDPEAPITINEMAERFGTTPDELRVKIKEADMFFRELARTSGCNVVIYYLKRSMTFTFYRFNTHAVYTTYRHKPGKDKVVSFVCRRGGEFYDWLRSEWYGMTEDGCKIGIARQVYPESVVTLPPEIGPTHS